MNAPTTIPAAEQAVAKYLQLHTCHGPVAVGLSGGVDSVVLCESLVRSGAKVVALHFNHHWRGDASDADEAWVAKWCFFKKIEIHLGHSATRGATSENAARTERYRFFNQMAASIGFRQLWLAHHADDVVETFLMQLMRGAGPGGLSGIRDTRKIGRLEIIRPFTSIFKNELETQARLWKLRWRKDSSNKDRKYLRNRVRLDALPALSKAMGRDIRPTLLKTALLLQDENEEWQKKHPKQWPEKPKVADLKKMTTAHQRRWIHRWLESQNVPNIDFADIESIRGMLTQLKPSKINLSQNIHCRRKEGVLFLEE